VPDLNLLIKEADNFLIDRGDLSKEVTRELIPYTQRFIIQKIKAQNKNGGGVRQSVIEDQRAKDILDQDEILVASIALFESGTKLGPHKDPPVYGKAYRRIQIPLYIPSDECYMIWDKKKIIWREGEPQVYDVMDYVHEGYNLSDDDMMFLFVDIEKRDDNSNLQEV